jgi:hypothetical protein
MQSGMEHQLGRIRRGGDSCESPKGLEDYCIGNAVLRKGLRISGRRINPGEEESYRREMH